MKLRQILSYLEKIAPISFQESYDNSGLIIGNPDSEVTKVLVCLDVYKETLDDAVAQGCNTILSHHPAIFKAIKSFTGDTREGMLLTKAVKHDLAILSCHTNFDSALGGLTDLLCARLGLFNIRILKRTSDMNGIYGQGRLGDTAAISGEEFIERVKSLLSLDVVRYVGSIPESIFTAAVYNGSYDRDILGELCAAKPDVLITGDLKYHDAQELMEKGIFTIDAGHYGTEKIFTEGMARLLKAEFFDLEVIRYKGSDVFAYR